MARLNLDALHASAHLRLAHHFICPQRLGGGTVLGCGAVDCRAGMVNGAHAWTARRRLLRHMRLDPFHHSISYWTACAHWAAFSLQGCRWRRSLRRQIQLRSMPHSVRLTDGAAQLNCILHCLVGALHTGGQGQSSACPTQTASNRLDAGRQSF